jgi:hypothetical protein
LSCQFGITDNIGHHDSGDLLHNSKSNLPNGMSI